MKNYAIRKIYYSMKNFYTIVYYFCENLRTIYYLFLLFVFFVYFAMINAHKIVYIKKFASRSRAKIDRNLFCLRCAKRINKKYNHFCV